MPFRSCICNVCHANTTEPCDHMYTYTIINNYVYRKRERGRESMLHVQIYMLIYTHMHICIHII